MSPLELLKRRYLSHTTRLRYRPRLEGQQIDKDGALLIGNRAGPTLGLANLIHELCHFVEIDDARMVRYGWGLHVPRIWVYDRYCTEPVTMSMTARELRVCAYQLNVLESLGAPTRASYLVSPLKYMADSLYVPLEDGRSAYGKDSPRGDEMNGRAKEASQIRWMTKRATELRAEYTLERFDREFARKIQILETNFPTPPGI